MLYAQDRVSDLPKDTYKASALAERSILVSEDGGYGVYLLPPPLVVGPGYFSNTTSSEPRLPITVDIDSNFDPKTTGPWTTPMLQYADPQRGMDATPAD